MGYKALMYWDTCYLSNLTSLPMFVSHIYNLKFSRGLIKKVKIDK